MGIERRKHRRVALRLHVRVEPGAFVGTTQDLSEGGVFIRSPRTYRPGTRLRLMIKMSSGWAEAEALVRWLQRDEENLQSGIGVEFSWVSPQAKKYISTLRAPARSIFVATEDPTSE